MAYRTGSRWLGERVRERLFHGNHFAIQRAEWRLWAGPWQWAVYEVRDLKTARDCQERGAHFVETMAVRGFMAAYAESRRR